MRLAQFAPSPAWPPPYAPPAASPACPACPPPEIWTLDPFNILLVAAVALAVALLVLRADKGPSDPVVIPPTQYEGGVCHGFSMRVQYPSKNGARGDGGGETIRAYTDRRFGFHIKKATATRFRSTVKLELDLTSSGGVLGSLEGKFIGIGPYGQNAPGSEDDREDCFAYVVGHFTVWRKAMHRRHATLFRGARAIEATSPTPLEKACLTVEFHRDLHDMGAFDLDALEEQGDEDGPIQEMAYPGTAETDVTLTGWGFLPGKLFVPENSNTQSDSTFLLTFYAGRPPPNGGMMEPVGGGFGGGFGGGGDFGGGGGGGVMGGKSIEEWAKIVDNA